MRKKYLKGLMALLLISFFALSIFQFALAEDDEDEDDEDGEDRYETVITKRTVTPAKS